MIKECKKHGLTEYTQRTDRNNKTYVCKACRVDATQKRRIKVKKMAIEYKGGCCSKCGYNKCDAALEFHHKDPTEKDFGFGAKGYTRSWEKMKEELDKCILVCANCHREIHYNAK